MPFDSTPMIVPAWAARSDVGDLGEHRIGQVLDHQGHAVGLGPAEGEECARFGSCTS